MAKRITFKLYQHEIDVLNLVLREYNVRDANHLARQAMLQAMEALLDRVAQKEAASGESESGITGSDSAQASASPAPSSGALADETPVQGSQG